MAEALVNKSTLAVKLESIYGLDPTIAVGDVIEAAGVPNLNNEFELKERTVVKNTFSTLESVRGSESASGEIPVEPKGSGTAGVAPDADALFEAAIGIKTVTSASTTNATAASATTVVELVAGGVAAMGIVVGDAIYLPTVGTGEVVWVISIATDALTVSPALSSAPGLGVAVGAGVHYKLSNAGLKSFWTEFWRGDITKETYPGNTVESLALNFSTGEIATAVMSLQGQKALAPVTEAYGLGTPVFDSTTPIVAVNMVLTVGGVSTPLSALSLELANTLLRKMDMTTSGTQKILQTKRKLTGSFNLLYESKAIEDDFQADTKSEIRIVGGSVAGNILAIRLPLVRYTATPKSDDSGTFKYDVAFEAVPSSVGDDELTSYSYL